MQFHSTQAPHKIYYNELQTTKEHPEKGEGDHFHLLPPQVPHLQIQPTYMEHTGKKKKKEFRKFRRAKLEFAIPQQLFA